MATTTVKSIELYLYLLERTETAYPGEWAKCIVAAKSEESARQIANESSEAEGYVWTDRGLTQSKKIGIADDEVQGIVLSATE
jgi:hypothetical protein